MIRCRTLGPPTLESVEGEVPPELRWRKHLALLVYLARSPRRTRSRDHLIGLLWGEKPEKDARHSLREAMRILRRTLGEEHVLTSGEQVTLGTTALAIDVDEFDALAGAGDWVGAAALVHGGFLDGFAVPDATPFEDWLAAERLLWKGRTVEALRRAGEQRLAEGALEGAVSLAEQALAIDPSAEGTATLAMRGLALMDRRGAALEAYAALEGALRAAGAEPGAEIRALAARVRRGPLPTAPARERAARRRAPLVGRARELSQLMAVWTEARESGRASAAMVAGDPGLGKSRLLEELVARVRLDGAVSALARAVAADQVAPWSGLFGLVQSGLVDAPGAAGAPPGALAAFARRMPVWAERFPGAVRVEPSDPGAALTSLVAAIVEETPTVLVIDDAHWLDHQTLLALEALLRDLPDAPLAVGFGIGGGGPEPFDQFRAKIGRDVPGTVVALDPLDLSALRDLATWTLPDWSPEQLDRLARRVAADSAGLPLFATKLLQAVASGLELEQTGGTWPQPFKTLSQTLPGDLPDSIVSAIRVGYRRLSQAAQQVLAAASVLGDRVPVDPLVRVTGLPEPTVTAALDELEWGRWLAAEPRGYGFVARIVRDVIARDMLTAGQRQRITAAASG